MKEVSMQRYAGLFKLNQIPFGLFIQSSIGLVLKAGGKTRLIFHLSFDFNETEKSVNACMPTDICSVKYCDLDHAIQVSIDLLKKYGFGTHLFYGKADLVSAFRILPIKPSQRKLLMMKARHPVSKMWFYFVDKCLPFGSSISCAHFQLFSDALACIMEHKLKMKITNYLDDFLFVATSKSQCNNMVTKFLETCNQIGCPVSKEKTEWASKVMIFLGVLLDGEHHVLAIPQEKRLKALTVLDYIINKKKVTIKAIQKLTGFLNFLQPAIVPGRPFTRRLYEKLCFEDKNGNPLKQFHHVNVEQSIKEDCMVWKQFLDSEDDQLRFCHPFIDLHTISYATTLNFYSDASLNARLGFGVIFQNRWTYGRWSESFIRQQKPSIEFLELYALVVGILIWGNDEQMTNNRVIIYCDNEAMVHMVNNLSSRCTQCMKLIRMLTFNCLIYNRRLFVKHIRSEANILADSWRRMDFKCFWKNVPASMVRHPDLIPDEIWPVEKIWFS